MFGDRRVPVGGGGEVWSSRFFDFSLSFTKITSIRSSFQNRHFFSVQMQIRDKTVFVYYFRPCKFTSASINLTQKKQKEKLTILFLFFKKRTKKESDIRKAVVIFLGYPGKSDVNSKQQAGWKEMKKEGIHFCLISITYQ